MTFDTLIFRNNVIIVSGFLLYTKNIMIENIEISNTYLNQEYYRLNPGKHIRHIKRVISESLGKGLSISLFTIH